MLKIWKQAWKNEDSARRPQSGGDSDDQGAMLGRTSRAGSPQTSTSVAPPDVSGSGLGPILPLGQRGNTKRTRPYDSEPSMDSDFDRLQKRAKVKNGETSHNDPISNHLPEIPVPNTPTRSEILPIHGATFPDELFAQAKIQNSEKHLYKHLKNL